MLRYGLLILLLTSLTAHASPLPPFLRDALARFNPDIPFDLAYTITTQRGEESSVERYDPSLPEDRRWTLLQRNHRPANPEENARYGSYRLTTASSPHTTFKRGDIDLGSLLLVSEDETRAEFQCRFRDDLNDPMLRKLELRLTVSKQPAAIERYVLQLTGPFSPVLTVKMLELRVETILGPPVGDHPALPQRVTSRFRGRVLLFKSIAEDVQTAYSDFTPVVPLERQSAGPPP